MDNMVTLHRMPINDIRHAYSEERSQVRDGRVFKYVVYVGVCECGAKFEGPDSSGVTRDWMTHLDNVEGGR